MPVETRAQLTARYLVVVEAVPLGARLPEVEDGELEADGLEVEEEWAQRGGWWEEELAEMASGSEMEGRQRFSGKKGDGLTHKQFTLMVKGSLADRFKKLQKDHVGNPVEGTEFQQKYCIYLGEFLDNPAKASSRAGVQGSQPEGGPGRSTSGVPQASLQVSQGGEGTGVGGIQAGARRGIANNALSAPKVGSGSGQGAERPRIGGQVCHGVGSPARGADQLTFKRWRQPRSLEGPTHWTRLMTRPSWCLRPTLSSGSLKSCCQEQGKSIRRAPVGSCGGGGAHSNEAVHSSSSACWMARGTRCLS
jgi:hypothetical protein